MNQTLHSLSSAKPSHSLAVMVVVLLATSALLLACSDSSQNSSPRPLFKEEVRVGILHSRTGTMAISEHTVAEAELLAIEEINHAGGLKIQGERLEIMPIEEDGASDWPTFTKKAAQLIDREKVVVIFGGWTSASRKAMLPVFESRNHLLFYPIQYEGQECSKNIFYAGATPNQQAAPAVDWLLANKSKDFFLAGSDYVYPRTVNSIIRAQLKADGGNTAGEGYIPLGSRDVAPLVQDIKRSLPNGGAVINTLNGDSNVEFFRQMKEAGIDEEHGYSIMSFSISEEEVLAIGADYLKGTYAAWSFFETLDTPESRTFTESFTEMHGINRVTSEPAEAAYSMVYLWAAAAEKAGSTEPDAVRKALIGMQFASPAGLVEVMPNHHLSKEALIGRVDEDGMFEIVARFGSIDPVVWSPLLETDGHYLCDWRLDRPDAGRFKP
ncbi:MAG: urea ABC transporter substrate-binding protein [Myxococcota bacterium]|jgi:urea transport system substrate-binding protein|nr:urea ABC transporter substrate-binding protein [Myxococcota bacterium]